MTALENRAWCANPLGRCTRKPGKMCADTEIPAKEQEATMSEMQEDAVHMDYEEWCEKHGDELWIIYHEEGANHDTDYEAWCEKKYNDYPVINPY